MSLAVLGKQCLDDLEKTVVDLFENVENKNGEAPLWYEHPYLPEDNWSITRIVPIQDMRIVSLLFAIPDLTAHYTSKPGIYCLWSCLWIASMRCYIQQNLQE